MQQGGFCGAYHVNCQSHTHAQMNTHPSLSLSLPRPPTISLHKFPQSHSKVSGGTLESLPLLLELWGYIAMVCLGWVPPGMAHILVVMPLDLRFWVAQLTQKKAQLMQNIEAFPLFFYFQCFCFNDIWHCFVAREHGLAASILRLGMGIPYD